MHVCPMCTGTVPHVGGPVTGPGAPNILINNKPAAVMGDMCTCVGPPDVIAQGEASVFFNGVPAVSIGAMTAHGGSITVGEPNVIISTSTPSPSVTMAVTKIPFPKITVLNKVIAAASGNSLDEAIKNQEKLKNEAEDNKGEPRIFNLQWVKEDRVIRESKVLKEVTLRAHVQNIDDGTSITFKVKKPITETDEEGTETTTEEDVVELTGTVKDKMVEVTWEVEDPEENEETEN